MDLAQLHGPSSTGLTHSFVDGEQGGGNAVRASISTPVTPAVLTVQSASTTCRSGRSLKSTLTFVRGSGWHSGMSSLVRLVAMIPAMRGNAQHIAFLHGAALHSGECLGVHGDDAVGGGLPEGDGLLAHIHHHGVAGGIKVGQIGFRCIHIFTLSFVQPLGLVASSSTAPLVGEPLAKPFTLRGLPKPPLDRSNNDDRRQCGTGSALLGPRPGKTQAKRCG